jgi:long-chain acyl-CoA synthetase
MQFDAPRLDLQSTDRDAGHVRAPARHAMSVPSFPLTPETIGCEAAGTLSGLFRLRVARTPDAIAYQQFETDAWRDYTWSQMAALAGRWQRALSAEGLQPGDRIALSVRNGTDWVCCDLATLGLGLISVPLYTTDSPANVAHILADSGARLLLLDSDSLWHVLARERSRFPALQRVICVRREADCDGDLVRALADWLPADALGFQDRSADPDALATIVYTSGTTGPPKGVMQSHRAILWTAEAVLRRIPAWMTDCFISFLPLAHSFERTVGYYLPMMAGCRICYARSVERLREDLRVMRPTVMLAVPRVYDKIFLAIQKKLGARGLSRRLFEMAIDRGWRRVLAAQGRGPRLSAPSRVAAAILDRVVARRVRAKLGGRLRVAVSGGAPLSPVVARFFMGLGVPLTEGYGLTEASPVLTNTRPADCLPGSVGVPLPGIALRIGPQDEILARTPGRMLGYWKQPEATAAVIDSEGWLHTGDQGEIRDGYVFIRGRIKEILVTSTGHKVAPAEMEIALTMDPLIEQALILGEGRPYLGALLILGASAWEDLAVGLGLDPADPGSLRHPAALGAVLARVQQHLQAFPAQVQVRAVHLSLTPWTVDEGLLTPTLKARREQVEARFAVAIRQLYGDRDVPWELG